MTIYIATYIRLDQTLQLPLPVRNRHPKHTSNTSILDKILLLMNDDTFSHFETQEDLKNIKTSTQLSTTTLGLIAMGTKTFYEESKDTLSNTHLPYKESFPGLIMKAMKENFPSIPEMMQVTVGHEHGTSNGKCHYQMCVEFFSPCRCRIKPFEFVHDGFTFLCMAQKARNNRALKNYCLKDGDYYYLFPEKVTKLYRHASKNGTEGKVDPYKTIANNVDTFHTKKDAIDFIIQHDPKTVMTNYKNVEYALENILTEPLPEFKWTYPSHLLGKFPLIEEWFNLYCTNDNLQRKKALVLFSETRALGKTRFAQSLVPHPSYYIIFRNSFTNEAIKGKDNAKLLILDDMTHYTKENKEVWKALLAGEETSIRDAYVNFLFSYHLPCIVTTNNKQMFVNMLAEPEFQTQAYFIQIDTYIGPPETRPQGLSMIHKQISPEIQQMVDCKIELRNYNR
jgi:hypothetical protein